MSAQIIRIEDFLRRRLARTYRTVADVDSEIRKNVETRVWIRKKLAEEPMPPGTTPHRWLADLDRKFGDLMALREKLLGLTPIALPKRRGACGICCVQGHNRKTCPKREARHG
jgi:hypothetical protein